MKYNRKFSTDETFKNRLFFFTNAQKCKHVVCNNLVMENHNVVSSVYDVTSLNLHRKTFSYLNLYM